MVIRVDAEHSPTAGVWGVMGTSDLPPYFLPGAFALSAAVPYLLLFFNVSY